MTRAMSKFCKLVSSFSVFIHRKRSTAHFGVLKFLGLYMHVAGIENFTMRLGGELVYMFVHGW